MGIETSGAGDLASDLQQLADKLQGQTIQNKVGLAALRIIKGYTRAGQDYRGRSFPAAPTAEAGSPYSPGHAKKRKEAGLPVNTKNLSFDQYGGMLDRLDHVVSRDMQSVSLIVDQPEKEKIAGYLMKGAGKSRVKHEFFKLSDKSIGKINDLIGQQIDDFLTVTNLTE